MSTATSLASQEGLQERLTDYTRELEPIMTKGGNNVAYYRRMRYFECIPTNVGELAALITNALNDHYLRGLMDRARPKFEGSDEAKLTMTRTLSPDNETIFPHALKEMYLDTEGFHLVEGNGNERKLPYRIKIGDVLPHAIYFAEEHGSFLVGNGIAQMSSNIANNAIALEHKLSQADS